MAFNGAQVKIFDCGLSNCRRLNLAGATLGFANPLACCCGLVFVLVGCGAAYNDHAASGALIGSIKLVKKLFPVYGPAKWLTPCGLFIGNLLLDLLLNLGSLSLEVDVLFV